MYFNNQRFVLKNCLWSRSWSPGGSLKKVSGDVENFSAKNYLKSKNKQKQKMTKKVVYVKKCTLKIGLKNYILEIIIKHFMPSIITCEIYLRISCDSFHVDRYSILKYHIRTFYILYAKHRFFKFTRGYNTLNRAFISTR